METQTFECADKLCFTSGGKSVVGYDTGWEGYLFGIRIKYFRAQVAMIRSELNFTGIAGSSYFVTVSNPGHVESVRSEVMILKK